MSVLFLLTPPEGLLDVLTPARLSSFRKWFLKEWTQGEGPMTAEAVRNMEEEEREDLEKYLMDVQGLVELMHTQGAAALSEPPEEYEGVQMDLLDELAEFFIQGGLGPEDALERATDRTPDDKDLQAAEAVIGAACPDRTRRLWKHLVWGRAPGTEVGVGVRLQREVPSLGYWTRAEVRQMRDDLAQHLGGPPGYKPVRGLARLSSMLQRTLTLASRGNPTTALDAVSRAVERAAREGAGLLFAR